MDLKDKLNLVWKFSFLAIFSYAVFSMTCCSSSSSSCGTESDQCCKTNITKSVCGENCTKACCKK